MSGPPYIEVWSSAYMITSMYVQPAKVETPCIHETIYAEIADYLDYAPLLIKFGDVHTHMVADNTTPAGVLSVPESLAEESHMDRFPDEKEFLIASEGGASIVGKLFSDSLFGDEL